MSNLKLEKIITKLNRLTNDCFQLSSDQKQLCINDTFCFCIRWKGAIGAKAELSLQCLENNSKSITVFNRVTPLQSKQLTAAGVNYLDLAGNAHITATGLYIFIHGQRASHQTKPTSTTQLQSGKAFQASGLKVIYLLLNTPNAQQLSFREIAQLANVSLGSVSAVINDLSAHHFIDKATRQILNRPTLIERWAQTYPYQLRNKLMLGRFTSNNPNLYEQLQEGCGYQLSGELAAQQKYNYLTAKHAIIYADDLGFNNLKQHGRLRKLKEQEQPEITIDVFNPFWSMQPNSLFAPELIIYSDLISSNEPRNIEVAQRIYHDL